MNSLGSLLPFVLIIGAMWFLLIRPANKRQREALALQNSLQVGQRIMTTSGMFGTITEISDDELALEIAPGVVVRWVTAAVARVVHPDEPAPETSEAKAVSDRPNSASEAIDHD